LDGLAEMTDEQQEEYGEIEGRLDELKSYIDVYDVLPTNSSHYDFNIYRVKGMGGLRNPKEYATKRSDDAFESLVDYYRNSIDDVGLDSYSNYVKDNLDGDRVAEDFRDYYDEDIRDNLESYFDNVGYSEEQQERIQELEDYINELDDKISELQDQMVDEDDQVDILEYFKSCETSSLDVAKSELSDLDLEWEQLKIMRIKFLCDFGI
jgi:predicted nuclease with TOPRIM domain